MGTQPLPKKGAEPQIFGPCLLWPNGWMDQDGTWHACRPQLRQLCVRWEPSPLPKKGAEPPPQFSANFYCAQTAGCITMLLGMQVGLSPGTLCSMGTQPPLSRKGAKPPPNFRPMSIVAKRLDGSRWNLTRRWALVQATLC